MDKALVYGTRDSGFDPQWSRFAAFYALCSILEATNIYCDCGPKLKL